MFILFTDFGIAGPYLGQVRAVLQVAAPARPVVDACADAPVFDARASAYLLASLVSFYPTDSIWLAVVDPGVGTERDGLILQADGRWFVGPDNGLLSRVASNAREVRLWRILWRPERLSSSFHGRDWFAPVAAELAQGRLPECIAMDPAGMQGYGWARDLAEVIYVDHYGNLVTGLRAEHLDRDALLLVGSLRIAYARTFARVPEGTAFWYENAFGLVEIAVNQGRADQRLGIGVGDEVRSEA
ncbi:SAM hydrolase/SAM-dependent halogenase family protein [Thioalkalivibrio sulfidiphilus]|uniref:SAM hydrolase/SAM-dependent halogenase family protein n=1 Tax=Thioalkalivibrio sulfidiphilus TaxID=1033854 RepID=UPI00037C2C1F|nr:SAM-dependent chlorinase/fluorinase [Thioalkalivibrio sulfidiphilus]